MLIAEDLLLLITDDATGRISALSTPADRALGGANLIELALTGRAGLTGPGDLGKPGRIIVRDPAPTGDEILDAALQILIAQQGRRPAPAIGQLSRNLRQALYERLAARGTLRTEQHMILGVIPARRWTVQDTGHQAKTRELVTGALAGQTAPDTRTAALIALVHALGCEHKVASLAQLQLSRRQLRRRADEITKRSCTPEAGGLVIGAVVAAVTAAMAVATSG